MASRHLPQDIVDRANRDFGLTQGEWVISTFENLQLPLSSMDNDWRVMRCILFWAHGDREKFLLAIDQAKQDWRDTIVSGEYDTSGSNWVRVRDLTHSFPD